MTLRISAPSAHWTLEFPCVAGTEVVVGRGRTADVRIGHERVQGRWTVSKNHATLSWDGRRWTTTNVSERPGLFHVYEPGYEEVPLEPGRNWAPARHRWSYSFGSAGHRFELICETDDHAVLTGPTPVAERVDEDDEEPTSGLDTVAALSFTDLERSTIRAYYGTYGVLPRPRSLEPASHDAAAAQLGRSRDSLRKAVERINEKISTVLGAPELAAGRNVSGEIGRWLARLGLLDP